MKPFSTINQRLHIEAIPLDDVAQQVKTPLYAYSQQALLLAADAWNNALPNARIHFALKANGSLAVAQIFQSQNFGMDVVSQGEAHIALAAHTPPHLIIFSGVGKTRDDILFAAKHNIQINAESPSEVSLIQSIASSSTLPLRVALRVNPATPAGAHPKIRTGGASSKFGVRFNDAPALYQSLLNTPNIKPHGLAIHIGSLVSSIEPFKRAFLRLRSLAKELNVRRLDLGGGLAPNPNPFLHTPPLLPQYAQLIHKTFPTDVVTSLEPGRALIANAGVMLTSVIHLKPAHGRTFLIVDAAMNDFPRPSLYGAKHPVVPILKSPKNAPAQPFDVAGPVCESADVLARRVLLHNPQPGTILAFLAAGAYCSSMASQYNARPLIPDVLVQNNQFHITRPRPAHNHILKLQFTPKNQ